MPAGGRARARAASWLVGVALGLAGCTALEPAPLDMPRLENVDTEPIPAQFEADAMGAEGQVVEILRATVGDDEISVRAARGTDGICVELWHGGGRGGGGGGCGGLPGGMLGDTFGTIGAGAGTGRYQEFSGVVSEDVADVAVEQRGARPARAVVVSLEPVGVEANYFLAVLPEEAVAEAIVALGADGSIIDRFRLETVQPAPPAGAPMATAPGS